MAFQGRKGEGVEEGSRQEPRRQQRRTTSSLIPGSQFQSARGIVDCIHTLLEQLLNIIDSSTSTRSSQQINEINEDVGEEREVLKYTLRFVNQVPTKVYTQKQIIGENGEPLQVAICDATNGNPIINLPAPLSSSQIQFFILQGDFADEHQGQQISWTSTDFDQSVLLPRDGKGPLMIGKDLKLSLNNGVGYLRNLVITDNSTWLRSRAFRLGAKVVDPNILAKFPRIGEALSRPFRVMDQRSKGNEKHHPPKWEDEVWRLDGVGKTGRIINLLSSKGIKTVGDFLTIHQTQGFSYLKQLLSEVPDRIWNLMYCNALEYYSLPVAPSLDFNLVQNEAEATEDFSGTYLKVESIDDEDDEDLSNDTLDQRSDGQFQAALEPSHLTSHQPKYLGENEVVGINTNNNVDDGHDHGNLSSLELPDSPCFSASFEKLLMDIAPMLDHEVFTENPLLSTHEEPSTSFNDQINSACFHLNSKKISMENSAMGSGETTLDGNTEIWEKDNFDVGQENPYSLSTFSNFISSSMEDDDLMLPQIFMQNSLPVIHSDDSTSTSVSYNCGDLAPFSLSFEASLSQSLMGLHYIEENFNENLNDGHGHGNINLNTSNLVSTFSNYVCPPLDDGSLNMFPQISLQNPLHMKHSDNLPSTSYSLNHENLAPFPLSYENNLMWENPDEGYDVGHGNLSIYHLLFPPSPTSYSLPRKD